MNALEIIIKEFKSFSDNGVWNMSNIKSWLTKYEGTYLKVKQEEDSKNLMSINGELVVLPEITEPSRQEGHFLFLYKELEKLCDLHKKESYFKQEMAIYKEIENKPQKVIRWLIKNEKLGAEDHGSFLVDYLNYFAVASGLKTTYHLRVYLSQYNTYSLFVDREDFKHTIDFKETFDCMYWKILEELNTNKLKYKYNFKLL